MCDCPPLLDAGSVSRSKYVHENVLSTVLGLLSSRPGNNLVQVDDERTEMEAPVANSVNTGFPSM